MTDPTTCHICGVQQDCGLGFSAPRGQETRWLCIDCAALVDDIKRIKRMDAYEHKALDRVDDIAGDFAAEHGTDMAAMDDLTRRMLWKTVVQGYGNALRAEIREGVPF
jgi:hypothetical protein